MRSKFIYPVLLLLLTSNLSFASSDIGQILTDLKVIKRSNVVIDIADPALKTAIFTASWAATAKLLNASGREAYVTVAKEVGGVGLGMLVVGVIGDWLFASPVAAGTLAEFYSTKEGFLEFQKLPIEDQLSIAQDNEQLATLVHETANLARNN